MVYLDYAANTPVDKEVLDKYYDISLNYYGNPNSSHKMGRDALYEIDDATLEIAQLLHVITPEIIYTSGATEANNLAIRGACERYRERGNHIILSSLEHSSLISSAVLLESQGFVVDYVPVLEDGVVDIQKLEEMIRDDTIFVSVVSVDSELGIAQPIEEIGKMLKEKHPNVIFHTDASQSIGKVEINFENVDLVTISPHKFYGINDLGILIKKDEISLKPIILGGKSTTVFRSGTPNTASIVANCLALKKALEHHEERFNYVKELRDDLVEFLGKYEEVHINSTANSLPYLINFSVKGVSSNRVVEMLDKREIYLSSKNVSLPENVPSKLVMALTNSNSLAASSIRIGLSHLTTKEEIEEFKKAFEEVLQEIMAS